MENKINFGRFKKTKKPNYKKSILLIVLLLIAIYFFVNAEKWLAYWFKS
jgi:hypothetical protein